MAFSYLSGAGDGSTTNYSVTFGYLDKTHVFATVGGVTAPFTWVSDSIIQFTTAPALGALYKIFRKTSPGTPLVTYTSGFLSQGDLNEGNLQNFYLAQEANDTANDALGLDTTAQFDARSLRIKNVAIPVDPTDAARISDVQAVSAATGNVPTPVLGDAGKFLKATGAALFSWFSVVAADISDATTFGKSLLLAASATAARTLLGLAYSTKSQMQTGTDNATAVTPARVNDHDGVAKASLYLNTTGSIIASVGIASVVRNSAGVYTVTFTTAFVGNYYVVALTENGQVYAFVDNGNKFANSCIIKTQNTGTGTATDALVNALFFGRQ